MKRSDQFYARLDSNPNALKVWDFAHHLIGMRIPALMNTSNSRRIYLGLGGDGHRGRYLHLDGNDHDNWIWLRDTLKPLFEDSTEKEPFDLFFEFVISETTLL